MNDRPNLLLITTDQQRFDTIAAAADPNSDTRQGNLLTPHLDWLCATGIRYTRCYSDSPVCGPARATIMTGQHAWQHGQTENGNDGSPMAKLETLPGLLTAAGYQTHLRGKAHFNPVRANYGFEHMEILPDYYRWLRAQPGAKPAMHHGLGQNEIEPGLSTTEPHQTVTQWTVDRSIDFLETRDPTRPFFLWTSFSKPHPPFDPPAAYWQLYDGLPLPEPVIGDWADDSSRHHAFSRMSWILNSAHAFSAEKIQATRRAYYACITEVDYALGRLFSRLRELGRLDDTWIVFTSDHGEMLGDHRLGAKSLFFEGSAHVPLLVRPPGSAMSGSPIDERGGSTDDRLACLADLLPTFLNAADAGSSIPDPCDGLDLLSSEKRTRLFGECGPYHAVIEGERKLLFSTDGGHSLAFNVVSDPAECSPLPNAAYSDLEKCLTQHLSERGHPACENNRLKALNPVPTLRQAGQYAWPGFHSSNFPDCDLLH